jgi:hypothetical protein
MVPVHGEAIFPTGTQRDPQGRRQLHHMVLTGTDPLAALVDAGAVRQVRGARPPTDTVLGFQHQDVNPSGNERARGVQPGQPSADDHYLTCSCVLHCIHT